jgi:hypothetical protein
MMYRTVSVVVASLVALSVFATDKVTGNSGSLSIATTARIVRIDRKARTMRVRSSERSPSTGHLLIEELSGQRIEFKLPEIVMPGGITIALPGTGTTLPSKPVPDSAANIEEYNVVTTSGTLFQDGADPIRFDDFTAGETISIHGVLKGTVLTASRLAKWD